MRIDLPAVAAFTVFLLIAGAAAAQDNAGVFKTDEEKESYAVGMSMGQKLKRQGIAVKMEAFVRGFEDALKGNKALLSSEEFRAALMAISIRGKQGRRQSTSAQGEKNKREGAAFLAANGKKEGVVTLPSGLQYQVIRAGEGPRPEATDRVSTHYRGSLIDGKEFDSSYSRGQPATFPVNGVIRGWTEALLLMKVGAKWKLWVPPNLGYGPRGTGSSIGPNATLIFEVELLEIR